MTFDSRQLYSKMVDRGMSQADLSKASGVPREEISLYIRGLKQPEPATATKLHEALIARSAR
jgi:transcriptional regulator with XRE-family HTH domain